MVTPAGVVSVEAGDVVLNGGSTGLFSFSQSQTAIYEDPDFGIIDLGAVGYTLASFTFDFVEVPAPTNPRGITTKTALSMRPTTRCGATTWTA